MGSVDRVDDLTFRVNFSDSGIAKLKETVNDKLKEFMGDYTDESLVDYVIVLLRNGRRKEEARNELNVFLGDDSHYFVSWLWDHLAANLNLYLQPQESSRDEVVKINSTVGNQAGDNDACQLNSDSDRGKSDKLPRSRHSREWKGLVRDGDEPPPLLSSEVDNFKFQEKAYCLASHARRSASPRSPIQNRRSRPDERQHTKREVVSQASADAPRRLLQFAVRDAVGSLRSSSSRTEPSLKRLRSVVSASVGDSSLADHPRKIRSVARVANPMATVIKAVAEAAEDVIKAKSGSVFDRLGRDTVVLETTDRVAEFEETAVEDEEYLNFNQIQKETQSTYFRRSDHSREYVGKMTLLESDTGLAPDYLSYNKGYDNVNIVGRGVASGVSQTGTPDGNKDDDSLMVQYSVANSADGIMLDQPSAAAHNSSNIVNFSVNVNTWKPPHSQESRRIAEVDTRKSVYASEAGTGKSAVLLMKENSYPVTVGNGNAKPNADVQKETWKALQSTSGSYTAGRPLEDADSRTIFVSNVHFAATKDSLSRHFNKFGEVLKVVIVTDAATGQPKGSAYVEFMRKEAADNALSLDGTSFMSRLLKVVKRSSANQEASPVMTWSRARGSQYVAARFARVPFPRGIPGAFRPRLPIKSGARSLQWKREAQTSPAESVVIVPGNSVPSPMVRSLTYVRTESKPEGTLVPRN
ncbi:RRM_1 domain-containing protein/PWI domain-containing protein [Cephalotus follicularis]|uniref:RRM_1 domain-containing protein/PWI domain-containing protein n=1 Tax=Cephalotus follicularis TaxID=3775 RepID=A0A1Q3BXM3_CEPFO|nr:RRM_1 domain-containing protein/PWI domain-containing protein [Cephalotus follicularis]